MPQQGILVDGTLTLIPGVYPHVDVSAMTPPALGVTGILGVIAPSDGGLPDTIYTFTNYDDAAKIIRGGGLLSYLQRMFQPSDDPNVNGSSYVKFIRANPRSPPPPSRCRPPIPTRWRSMRWTPGPGPTASG